jgi:hypothetical protein
MFSPPGIGEEKVILSSSVAALRVSSGFLCYGAASEFLSNTIKRLQKRIWCLKLCMEIKLYAVPMSSNDRKEKRGTTKS